MTWAARRQAQYILGLFGFFVMIAFVIIYPMITKPATCSDGKKNGKETGVDCGGVCQRVCKADASEPSILWYRAFSVTGSVYNLVASIQNRNPAAGITSISYEFKIYDINNILIGRREGTTYIPPNQEFIIFEPRFDAGAHIVKSVQFSFTSPFIWVKKSPTLQRLPIKVINKILGDDKNSPVLSADLTNESIYDLPEFDVMAILYDKEGTVINASKTHKEGLLSNDTSLLLFTWPNRLSDDPVTEDVLVQINPFTVPF